MSMQTAEVEIVGNRPLLLNNPRTVDRFDPYSRAIAKINAKGVRRTDEDYLEVRDLEMRAKIYWDEDLGIYVPTTWVLSAIAGVSNKLEKISKATIRGGVFMTESKVKLFYRDMDKVAQPEDIVKNPEFRHVMILKQGQVRVVKAAPIFHKWRVSTQIEFDDKVIDPGALKNILTNAAYYGGFGDFRPTFGRAKAEVTFG